MRFILHVDMNSYFATVEQQSNPFLRGKPICVAGKGLNERTVCAAASIEAKKFGIKSGFPVWEAKRLCPQIQIVRADYAKYQFLSRKLIEIFERFTPMVEIFSIDEAFLDLSFAVKDYSEAQKIAQKIKILIKQEVGDYLTCSIGIAPNKLLAKLASEMKKPDGLTIIKPANIESILKNTPIEDMCGIGRRLKIRLNNLGIKTAWEIGECPVEKLKHFFGEFYGKNLRLMGQGKDASPVLSYREFSPEKSFGHSYTLPRDLTDQKAIKRVLLKLTQKVGRRLRKVGFWAKTIHFYVRFFDFSSWGKRFTRSYCFNASQDIYESALKILTTAPTKPIRMLGVAVSNLRQNHEVPYFLDPGEVLKEKVLKTTDRINDKYGEFTIFPSSLTKIKDKIQEIPDGRAKRFL